jgi:hypothetical protein
MQNTRFYRLFHSRFLEIMSVAPSLMSKNPAGSSSACSSLREQQSPQRGRQLKGSILLTPYKFSHGFIFMKNLAFLWFSLPSERLSHCGGCPHLQKAMRGREGAKHLRCAQAAGSQSSHQRREPDGSLLVFLRHTARINWRMSRVIRLEIEEDRRSSKNSSEFFDCGV